MKPTIEWVRRDYRPRTLLAGWDCKVDGVDIGVVWLDGSFTDGTGWPVNVGSQPLAAQALLRAAGVEP